MVTGDTALVRQRSGAAIVEALKAEGVEHIFGLVGSHVLEIYDALRRRADDPPHHRQARDDRQRHGRRLRAADRQAGRGAGDRRPRRDQLAHRRRAGLHGGVATGPHQRCRADRAPATSRSTASIDPTSSCACSRRSRSGACRSQRPEDIPHVFARAFALATSGRPGPVHIEIPQDVLLAAPTQMAPYARQAIAARPADRGGPRRSRSARSGRSERPVIWAGKGVRATFAHDALAELAELLEAPVILVRRRRRRAAGHPPALDRAALALRADAAATGTGGGGRPDRGGRRARRHRPRRRPLRRRRAPRWSASGSGMTARAPTSGRAAARWPTCRSRSASSSKSCGDQQRPRRSGAARPHRPWERRPASAYPRRHPPRLWGDPPAALRRWRSTHSPSWSMTTPSCSGTSAATISGRAWLLQIAEPRDLHAGGVLGGDGLRPPGRHGGQAGVPRQEGHHRDRRRLLPDGQRRLRHGGRERDQPGRRDPERPAVRHDRRDAGDHLRSRERDGAGRPGLRRLRPHPSAPTASASTSQSRCAPRSSAASPAPPSSSSTPPATIASRRTTSPGRQRNWGERPLATARLLRRAFPRHGGRRPTEGPWSLGRPLLQLSCQGRSPPLRFSDLASPHHVLPYAGSFPGIAREIALAMESWTAVDEGG